MAEPQPPTVHEGATTAESETPPAKSAEDRKAASALASLDADESSGASHVDHEAASKAMKSLGGTKKPGAPAKKDVKNVKVDPADVALLVDNLDLNKPKATELLKSHEGNAVKAMRAFINDQ
ncbi:Fc.00g004740.m01.CDS01 [Cosmosporella sp. VM-42]